MPQVLSDVIMSNNTLSSGVRGKNIRKNNRVQTDNGTEFINIVWTRTLRQYEFGTVPLRLAQWREIELLHEITEGGAYGFLLPDPKDCQAVSGVVADLGGGSYQLYNRRTHTGSGRYVDRKISWPKSAGFLLKSAGLPLTSGVDYTMDWTTGIFTTGAAGPLTWSGYFYTPVNFVDDSIDWTLVVPSGDMDARYWAGPSVLLQEIREY